MQNRAEEMRRWWAAIEPIRKLPYLKIKSIDDFLMDLGRNGKAATMEGRQEQEERRGEERRGEERRGKV